MIQVRLRMSNHSSGLIYALKNEKAIHISKVERGLKCNCNCPACGEPLVAKKGSVKMHHFAHYTKTNCEYGYESSLHIAAKEIISQAKKLVIPSVYLEFPNSNKEKQLISPSKEIIVDDVKLEQKYDNIIPDIVVISNEKTFFVEIFVTHKIDDTKLEKLKKANISTMEIDLSNLEEDITIDMLSEILMTDNNRKVWKHNAFAQLCLTRFYDAADQRRIVTRNSFYKHVDNCPRQMRLYKGTIPYANFIDDCLYCEYCIDSNEDIVFCTGRLNVSTLEDFSKSPEQRTEELNKQIQNRKSDPIKNRICPACGWRLVERHGKYGPFLGCSQYPNCLFRTEIIPNSTNFKIEKSKYLNQNNKHRQDTYHSCSPLFNNTPTIKKASTETINKNHIDPEVGMIINHKTAGKLKIIDIQLKNSILVVTVINSNEELIHMDWEILWKLDVITIEN